jgi:microcystin-dependent protein
MLIGQVTHFVSAAPAGWLEFDGSTHSQEDYPELFAALPSAWITGTDFTLPDLQDAFISGVGSGGTIAATGGSNEHVLTVAEMPAHSHTYTLPVPSPDTIGAGAPVPSVMSVVPATSTGPAGSDNAHENMPLFVSLVLAIYSGRV